MFATIMFPTASYIASRAHVVRLVALCLLVALALPAVAMLTTALLPLIALALPVVGKLLVGAALIACFAMWTRPA